MTVEPGKIGRVSGTEIIGQKIAVQLVIDNNFSFKIPIDSDIEITQSDLMGSKYIAIYPGKDDQNFILPGEFQVLLEMRIDFLSG